MQKLNKKILVVEDESALLNILVDKLRREGFVVFGAQNGQAGLHEALKQKPALILLDIVMPSMDGLTMLKKLREDKWGYNIPVIILSNLGDPEQIEAASGGGILEYLIKSNWDLGDIVQKIKDTLQKTQTK